MAAESPNAPFRIARSSLESKPFLADENCDSGHSKRGQDNTTRDIVCGHWSFFRTHILFHGLILLLYTFLFFGITTQKMKCRSLEDLNLYSPVEEFLEYEARSVDGLADGSVYAGYPRPESESAWKALMEGTNIKIYPEEMLKLGETSLQMRDGSGSLAVLGVYHELHCVKRLRKWFYREYYYPNQTELEFSERLTHAEHCLEFIRQAAMCHGDVTTTSFKWLHDSQGNVIEPTTKEGALHKCVKWDSISRWARSRRVDLFDPSTLAPERIHHNSEA